MNSFAFILLLAIVKYIISPCELNIGLNKFSAFMGKGIYYNGEIDLLFKDADSTTANYKSSVEKDRDCFYVAETIEANATAYEHIKIEIESSNGIAIPSFKYIPHKEVMKEVQTGEIEIMYNCKLNEIGESLLKLKLTPQSCPPFELIWIKECKSQSSLLSSGLSPFPLVDININGNDILINGTQINQNIFKKNSENPYIISTRRLNLYLSNQNRKENYAILPIEIRHSSNRGFGYIIQGYLKEGGQITSSKRTVSIVFLCLSGGMIDLEIEIPFENNQAIKMYFKKECGAIGRQITIGIARFFFWLIVSIVIAIVLLFSLIYLAQNPFVCLELYASFCSVFKELKYRAFQYKALPSRPPTEGNNTNDIMKVFDNGDDNEDLAISYQIKVSKLKNDKEEQMSIQVNKDYTMNDYGGI